MAGPASTLRAAFLVGLLVALPAFGQQRAHLVLGTATPGGGFPVYGEALVKTLAEVDPDLVIEPRNTAGSLENIARLGAGTLDLALVQGEAAHDAFASGTAAASALRIVAAMYSTAGMFVVRGDSPYRSIDDLRGRRIAFGARGSGLVALARYVLDGIGLDMERDFDAVLLERAGDGPRMLRDGGVAALWGGGVGWPGFSAAMSAPGGGRFIAPDRDQIARILARHPFLKPQTMPAGSYSGQASAIDSVGSWSFIVARATLSDDLVYRFCRALHGGEARFAQRLDQARETTARNTVAALERRDLLHLGARRCLEDVGALR
jgi:uncharacterized protein